MTHWFDVINVLSIDKSLREYFLAHFGSHDFVRLEYIDPDSIDIGKIGTDDGIDLSGIVVASHYEKGPEIIRALQDTGAQHSERWAYFWRMREIGGEVGLMQAVLFADHLVEVPGEDELLFSVPGTETTLRMYGTASELSSIVRQYRDASMLEVFPQGRP